MTVRSPWRHQFESHRSLIRGIGLAHVSRELRSEEMVVVGVHPEVGNASRFAEGPHRSDQSLGGADLVRGIRAPSPRKADDRHPTIEGEGPRGDRGKAASGNAKED